jgi:benzoyl-CoA reductase/2-hydroxyglutaryl-CoA dehydratase subunit BcrC/BadD/HgdB
MFNSISLKQPARVQNDTYRRIASLHDITLEGIIEAKESGKKVVGYYCTYSPVELALAAGAILAPLCANSKEHLTAADNDLPQNLCPVVRTLYDLAVTDTCPFFHFSDFVIAETTCDGKKKAYEFLRRIKPVHIMNLPQIQDSEASVELWFKEMQRLKASMEKVLNVKITDNAIRQAIHVANEEARVRKALFDLNKAVPALLTGKEMLTISSNADFSINKPETTALLDTYIGEIRQIAAEGYYTGSIYTPRVLLTGCPVGIDSDKIIDLIEESGALVVAMENCGGYKTVDLRIDENDMRDPLLLLAEKYLKVPCSVMCPDDGRIALLEQMLRDFNIAGVVDLTWLACHTYNIESYWVADLCRKVGLAFLHIETNFSDSDAENLRVRVEAFVEMMK